MECDKIDKNDEDTHEVTLIPFDESQSRASGFDEDEDGDEDGHGLGGPGVQCATQ